MAELKTQPTRKSVPKFIKGIDNVNRREDCEQLVKLMETITAEKPILWGDNIVGFGVYRYTQRSGQQGKWPLTGFSPRKQNLTIYIMPGFDKYKTKLEKLGKHKHSVSCLYLGRLSDVDNTVLAEIIADSVTVMRNRYCRKT
jgi:hypothetical protein